MFSRARMRLCSDTAIARDRLRTRAEQVGNTTSKTRRSEESHKIAQDRTTFMFDCTLQFDYWQMVVKSYRKCAIDPMTILYLSFAIDGLLQQYLLLIAKIDRTKRTLLAKTNPLPPVGTGNGRVWSPSRVCADFLSNRKTLKQEPPAAKPP